MRKTIMNRINNRPVNLAEREDKLNKIAFYTKTSLEAMPMTQLRELGAYLIPHARKLKKSEYIDALLEISEPHREQRLKESLVTLELMGDFDVTPEFINDCFTRGLTSSQCSQIIAEKLEKGGYEDSTIAKTKMKQLRVMLDSLSLSNVEIKPWTDDLYDSMKEFASKYHKLTNKEYAKTVETYGNEDNLRKVKGTPIIAWCNEVIDWAYSQDNLEKGWHKVSFALALTSGRRMDEIHGTCQFEAVNDTTLKATGLSKKREEDYAHESPCLINAYKWVNALNKLPEKRRNQENSVVNGTIRKAIEPVIERTLGQFELTTYKDSRDFYVSYLIAKDYNKSKHGSEINYAKKLIGHESKKQTLSYEKLVVELD